MKCSGVGNVNSPSHYTQGKYETIDIIKDMMTHEMYEGFLLGNVIKYLARYNSKNGVEDLNKARVYLKWLAEHVSKADEFEIKAEGSKCLNAKETAIHY